MHICLIWTLLVHSILGRFLLPYWDVSFVRLNTDIQLTEDEISYLEEPYKAQSVIGHS
jgi:hypothetical protein